jgi:hypothetical protein
MLTTAAGAELLVCQFPQALVFEGPTAGLTVASSPMGCLDMAVSKRYAGIIIYFSARKIRARDALIELCADLTTLALTRATPKCVSLDCRHRALFLKLQEAGIENVEIRLPAEVVDPWKMWAGLMAHESSLRIDLHVSRLCPFLRYRPISDQSELVTCGAYSNRMVLGGSRLREVCQAETYLSCGFYMNPRTTQ